MSEAHSRWMLVTFVLLAAIPLQIAAMVAHPYNTWLDWLVLGTLILFGWSHIDAPTPEP